ncbi:DUF4115 domain-containing protein [Streptomyces sp. XM4193]|uniref:helix-turn-helix domain-containing protein n=1 Tax=Streptomyces sp. XM4193 TaxID=2929782 RepID=UPI001FFB0FDA|nr:helix-turn-helix domain-containing protein [Streptomyces sp. XM4193]MCK1798776.1 DUF4115 domain-containing protein [Streptomyces sp. XM4193]
MSIGNSSAEDRPSVGRALKKARVDAGLSVDEVSATTRVRAPIVYAIEEDDYSRCGGDVYSRGHVRSLARAAGLSTETADELVAQYDAEHGGRPEPTSAAPLFDAERVKPESRRPNWTAAMVAAIVAVVGFVGFTLFSGGEEGGKSASPQASPSITGNSGGTTKGPEPSEPADDAEPDPTESPIAAAPEDRVTVKVVATEGSSWVSVEDRTGRRLHEGLLEDGQSETFMDKDQISLVLGNGGAIELFVNGKKVERTTGPGQVERLTYTKGDPEQG